MSADRSAVQPRMGIISEQEREFHARKIAPKRLEKGLTQDELAQRAKVSLRALQDWEAGARVPQLSSLEKVARVLELDLSESRADTAGYPQDLNALPQDVYILCWATANAVMSVEGDVREARRVRIMQAILSSSEIV